MWVEIIGSVYHRVEFPDLGDNKTANGALRKGRTPRYGVNRVCQRRAAHEAVLDVRGPVLWGPSALQPGDWGTREGLLPTSRAFRQGKILRLNLRAPVFLMCFMEDLDGGLIYEDLLICSQSLHVSAPCVFAASGRPRTTKSSHPNRRVSSACARFVCLAACAAASCASTSAQSRGGAPNPEMIGARFPFQP